MIADPRSVYNRIRSAGYGHAQACGILGNIQQESGFRTEVLGYDGTGSYGLCQWLGSRKQEFIAFAKSAGKPQSDWSVQVDFILHELVNKERRAGQQLRLAKTPAGAALAFSRWYERPAKSAAHDQKRMKYANDFSAKYQA